MIFLIHPPKTLGIQPEAAIKTYLASHTSETKMKILTLNLPGYGSGGSEVSDDGSHLEN